MQNQQKKRTTQKLWGWICLSINCIVVSMHLAGQHAEFLNRGILFSVLIICYGAMKTQLDKIKDDTAVVSIAIEYVCVYILTFLSGFKIADYLSSFSVLIALVITSLAELLIFLFITYRYAVRRFFSQSRQNSDKKS